MYKYEEEINELMKDINLANKKIALFDGYRESHDNIIHDEYGTLTKKGLSLLRYHYDWNNLMNVVEKINKSDWVTIKADECTIHRLNVNKFEKIIVEINGVELIKVVYIAVLKYVILYLKDFK